MRHVTIILALLFLTVTLNVEAAARSPMKVAVLEFGNYEGIDIDSIKIAVRQTVYDHVVDSLTNSERFIVIEREWLDEFLNQSGLEYMPGSIDPETARRIGEALDVPYLLCGNVLGISAEERETNVLENGVVLYTVRASLVMTLIDVRTGQFVAMEDGTGKSSSSKVKTAVSLETFTIGAKQVSQISLANALRKAADEMIGALIKHLDARGY